MRAAWSALPGENPLVQFGQHFYFHKGVFGEPRHLHQRAGGVRRLEVLRVDLVDISKMLHICYKNGRLDHAAVIGTCRF